MRHGRWDPQVSLTLGRRSDEAGRKQTSLSTKDREERSAEARYYVRKRLAISSPLQRMHPWSQALLALAVPAGLSDLLALSIH